MRVATIEDKALVESIVKHPDVFRFVSAGPQEFDATPFLAHPNLGLIVEGGCFLATWHGFGRAECHTNFLPTARGAHALKAATEALTYVFTSTNIHSLVTKVPQNNPAADWFARAMGFRVRFARQHAWTEGVSVEYYELDIDDWITHSKACVKEGRWFHETLDGLLPDRIRHPDDDVHDRYAGAASLMMKSGKPEKAVLVYNHWARFAGYEVIALLSTDPLRVDIRDCVLTLKDGRLCVEGAATCP